MATEIGDEKSKDPMVKIVEAKKSEAGIRLQAVMLNEEEAERNKVSLPASGPTENPFEF